MRSLYKLKGSLEPAAGSVLLDKVEEMLVVVMCDFIPVLLSHIRMRGGIRTGVWNLTCPGRLSYAK